VESTTYVQQQQQHVQQQQPKEYLFAGGIARGIGHFKLKTGLPDNQTA